VARVQPDKHRRIDPERKQARGLLLVDDHPILREGLAHLINREGDLKVCGQADTLPKALVAVKALKPELVIADIALKGGNGLELIKAILGLDPELPILILSVLDEALFAERSLRAGARGYVMKQEPIDELMGAIRRVLRGGRYLSQRMQERLLDNLSSGPGNGSTPKIDCLSNRELEVFHLVGQGHGTREIAEQLCLSIKTIETYRAHIKEKLKLRTGMELIRAAIKVATEEQRF
jgi:DNA-binding NarL/FixJ family response regulator